MKCGVVTVYNSENCGSFLQAYAMTQLLKKNGIEAVVVRQGFKGHSSTLLEHLRQIARCLLLRNFAGVKYLKQQRKTFKKMCENTFEIVDSAEDLECYILGSDVTWDLTATYFKNYYSFFWGIQFLNKKVISYAPSVGFAKAENLEKYDFIREALGRMSAVSVRDEISKELLQPYCDKEIQIVCDPTYLLDREDYDAIAKSTDLKDFLFIYYFGTMPTDYKEAVQSFAKQKGLKTVTFGSLNLWCDVSLTYDPGLFLSLYNKAEYIITNTFHGTVFATIYEKRFAVAKNDKPKVLDVLKFCEMADKMTNTAEDVSAILESEFYYEVTRKNISRRREESLQYLKTAIEG